MRSIYNHFHEGDVFSDGATKYYVREKYRGKLGVQLCSVNDPNSKEVQNITWLNPDDSTFDDAKVEWLDFEGSAITYCSSCENDVGEPDFEPCNKCAPNILVINKLKSRLGI